MQEKQSRGILARLIEKGVELILRKECNNINDIEISILATNFGILKGHINKIRIDAKEVNFKDLIIDKLNLETNKLDISYQIRNGKININDEFSIKFKLSISQISLKKILFSKKWTWLGELIVKELLNLDKLTDIKILNDLFEITGKDKKDSYSNKILFKLIPKEGKVNLEGISIKNSFSIPIEEKIFIYDIFIEDNVLKISGYSNVTI